jgi:hypothetical protein
MSAATEGLDVFLASMRFGDLARACHADASEAEVVPTPSAASRSSRTTRRSRR